MAHATKAPTDEDRLRFLSPAQFAPRVGRSPETIRRWISDGLIHVVVLGGRRMIPVTELDRLAAMAAPVKQP